jgi:hypothetical protein
MFKRRNIYQLAVLLSAAMFLFTETSGQQRATLTQKSEIGGGIGTLNYSGDLVRVWNPSFAQPALTAFYRHNISSVVSFRAGLTGGKLKADDRAHPIDAFASQRGYSFNITVVEASTVFEYHFLDWRDSKRHLRFTPYLMSGLVMFGISGFPEKNAEFSNVQLGIPIGGGVKYVLNPNWYLSFEVAARRLFFDYLDNISDNDPSLKNYQYGNRFDNDSYFFMGFTITRTFYDIPCPKSPY